VAARPDLSTERLWLRPLRAEDAEDLHFAYSDPQCLRYWHHPATTTLDETRDRIRGLVADDGHWAFGLHGDGAVLGYTGFVNGLWADGHAGFGYVSRRASWGNGYVAEASRPALGYGFDTVRVARTELWIQRENAQSVRVAEKLGCTRRNDAAVGLVYGLTAEQWRGEPDPTPVHHGAEPVLAVADVPAAIRWWVDVLGFRAGFVVGDPPVYAAVLAGPGWAGSSRVQLSGRADGAAGGSEVFVPMPRDRLDDLAARVAQLDDVIVLSPLERQPWGGRELVLDDGFGNRVRLAD
jgi:RimJ/RimL family protein N-acetyltransferase/catechol 2,3-dioxygenase-like lactoylglutathione lyase family enzyme